VWIAARFGIVGGIVGVISEQVGVMLGKPLNIGIAEVALAA